MKKILLLLVLTCSLETSFAQEKPVGLAYIDSINNIIESTAFELSLSECLPENESAEIEITTIGSTLFCVVRCSSGDKLFEFEYESMSWISIPLLVTEEHNIKTTRTIRSIVAKKGAIYVTLHWQGSEIIGNDDERPYVYEDVTVPLSYLQQLARK